LRVLALHADLIVFISRVWQTTCTAVRAGEEGFLIDSPVYPDELEALGGVLEQAGFPVSGLLATHADWDHLLGRLAFPGVSLGCADSTAARLAAEPGAAQRKLRTFDEEHYVDGRGPLALAGVQSLPVPGRLPPGLVALGQRKAQGECRVSAAGGHRQPAAHALRELVGDREAQPRAASRVAGVKAVEDLVDRARVDALLGVVADDQLGFIVAAHSGDRHVRFLRGVRDRIVDEELGDERRDHCRQ